MATKQITERHRSLLDSLAALGRPAHNSELRATGAHPQTIAEAVAFGLLERMGPACYTVPGAVPDAVAPVLELVLRYPKAVLTGATAEALRHGHVPDTLEATLPRSAGVPNSNRPVTCGGKRVSFRLSRAMPDVQHLAIAGAQVPVSADMSAE